VKNGGILLVDTSFLGDVLCAEPLVRAVAESQPAPIDFLTSPGGSGMLGNHPQIREVLIFDKRGCDSGFSGLWRMAQKLRARRYQQVICSHRSWRTAGLLWLAGIPERVGFHNASGALLYTKRVQYRKDLHEIQRNLELAGGGDWEAPRVFPTEAERGRARELCPDGPFVAIAPGSIWATKRWPQDYFTAVVRELDKQGVSVVLLGGPDDTPLCEEIATGTRAHNLAGQTNLRESAAVLESAKVMLTNDSAPMHLGVAAGIPVVAIYCATVPEFGFAPRGKDDVVLEVPNLSCRPCGIHGHKSCPERNFRCGKELAPERVMSALSSRLSF
jgi:heptosyltransferase-2